MQNTQLAGQKRHAPGAVPANAPMSYSEEGSSTMTDPSGLTNDQFLAQLNSGYYDGSWPAPQDQAAQAAQASNQLIRRNQNNQLATSGQPYIEGDQWLSQSGQLSGAWNGDNGQLTEKADRARREALSKRPPKQIPPFVQKLSSFLDNNSNEELIRWSYTGDSFIVLDEEQFANKLIPELFKHNNYASFVRQLNMYGFHKKVGLTDNSMRASERKAKSPSEYENAYFKKGRPELLWLIAKPRTSKKKKGTDDASEDEDVQDEQQDTNPTSTRKTDLVTLPRTQLATFQNEIQQLQRQQQHINSMIARFQHENTQYIRQATERHERHENSINAILQFLATFYSRNADNSGNIPNMFGGNLTSTQSSGNVQEVHDLDDGDDTSTPRPSRPLGRRPLALLPAPDVIEQERSETPEAASSRPISSRGQTKPPLSPNARLNPTTQYKTQPNSSLRETVDVADLPAKMTAGNTPEGTPPRNVASAPPAALADNIKSEPIQEFERPQLQSSNSEIMRLINNSNAASPGLNNLDFSSALKNYENASPGGPLTPEQRNNVLSMMANTTGSPMSNALLASANPNAQAEYLRQYENNQQQLDLLHKMQQEQDSRVQNLTTRLQPLSPHGSIPGLEEFGSANNYGLDNFNLNSATTVDSQNEDLNLNNWLNSDYVDDGSNNNTALNLGNADMGGSYNFSNSRNDQCDYFGDTSGSMPAVSGAQDGDGANLFDTSNQNGEDLFGEPNDDEDGTAGNDDLYLGDGTNTAQGDDNLDEGGKIIGSVGSSSAGRSPALEAVEDEEEGGRRKRQRTG